MRKLSGNFGKALAALTVLGAAVFAAHADLSGDAFHITASNDSGSGEYSVPVEAMSYDADTNTWSWSLESPVELTNGEGDTIAWLNGGNAFVAGDPAVNFGFAVQAGGLDTFFTITSALLSFPTIASPQAQAGAAFTITDTNHNGATLSTGRGKAYSAWTDGGPYADLVDTFSTLNDGNSASSDDNEPDSGYNLLGYSVSSMASSVQFTLTHDDLASGTNGFEVIPEPSTLALVALGALSMLRRR